MLALVAFLVSVPSGVLVAGSLSLWFWVGVVLIGLRVPIGLELWSVRAEGRTWLVLTPALRVLLGRLLLRAVVVIGGQI